MGRRNIFMTKSSLKMYLTQGSISEVGTDCILKGSATDQATELGICQINFLSCPQSKRCSVGILEVNFFCCCELLMLCVP